MWDPYAEFESATLPNGLTVYAAHWPERPWEAVGFLIHSGAEHDPVGLEGLSHFVEHLVSEGTATPQKDMRAFFEDCGGIVNLGVTGYPSTRYRFFVPADEVVLAKSFSMFGHMLLSAKFERFIERERQIIVGEFYRHYPVRYRLDLDERKNRALYTGYWLERFVRPLGSPKSITQIAQEDLQLHYDRHYTPANISIVCVGGMQLEELIKLLSESPFAETKKGMRTLLPEPAAYCVPPIETRYVFELSEHINAPIEVGTYKSVTKIPGNINGSIIRILSKMLDKRLSEEIREQRGWTYSADSSWYNLRHFYEFSINCDAITLSSINKIEDTVEACIASIADQEELFNKTKHRALASNFMIDPKGRDVCDEALGDLTNYQRIILTAEIGEDLERVTMDDVRSALKWLRPKQRWTLIIRP